MKVINQEITENFAMYQGDCVEVSKGLPDASVHFSIFSPPFANYFVYSGSLRDMGNCVDDEEFFRQFEFLIRNLYRVTKPGRLAAVHCKNLVNYKGRDGMAGLRDFRGEIIRRFTAHGWAYHSEVVIWKDPVIEMQRTKAHGLLHRQLCTDSTFSRQGLPEYLVMFRKWAEEGEEVDPVTAGSREVRFTEYIGQNEPALHEYRDRPDTERQYSIAVWQRYASPVWMDIRQTNVLNVQTAREDADERHMCPLQLDVIERAVALWTNPCDVVFSPFAGIGSEGYGALKAGRRFVGVELKESYYKQALKNLRAAEHLAQGRTLFDAII